MTLNVVIYLKPGFSTLGAIGTWLAASNFDPWSLMTLLQKSGLIRKSCFVSVSFYITNVCLIVIAYPINLRLYLNLSCIPKSVYSTMSSKVISQTIPALKKAEYCRISIDSESDTSHVNRLRLVYFFLKNKEFAVVGGWRLRFVGVETAPSTPSFNTLLTWIKYSKSLFNSWN